MARAKVGVNATFSPFTFRENPAAPVPRVALRATWTVYAASSPILMMISLPPSKTLALTRLLNCTPVALPDVRVFVTEVPEVLVYVPDIVMPTI